MPGAQKGLDILVKLGNGASPEVFTTIAGLRTKSITHNKEQVDVTSADNVDRWRELLGGAAVKSFSVTASGVLKDSAVMQLIMDAAQDDTFDSWQIIIPSIGTFEGAFQVTMSVGGDHDGEATYDLTLESAGTLEFTAS